MFEYHQLDVLKASGRRAAAEALERAPAAVVELLAARSASRAGIDSGVADRIGSAPHCQEAPDALGSSGAVVRLAKRSLACRVGREEQRGGSVKPTCPRIKVSLAAALAAGVDRDRVASVPGLRPGGIRNTHTSRRARPPNGTRS